MKETKLSLTNKKFKQGTADNLTLAGTIDVTGTFKLGGKTFNLAGAADQMIFYFDQSTNSFKLREQVAGIGFFDASKAYGQGDLVIYFDSNYQYGLYRANTDLPAGAFNPADFDIIGTLVDDTVLGTNTTWSSNKINELVDGTYNDLLDQLQNTQNDIFSLQTDVTSIETYIGNLADQVASNLNTIDGIKAVNEDQQAQIDAMKGIAPYDETLTYNTGDVVVSSGMIWTSMSDGVTGPFNGVSDPGTDWQQVSTIVDDANGWAAPLFTTLSQTEIESRIGSRVDQAETDLGVVTNAATLINQGTDYFRLIKCATAAGSNTNVNVTSIGNIRLGEAITMTIDSKNAGDSLVGSLGYSGNSTINLKGTNTVVLVRQTGYGFIGGVVNEVYITLVSLVTPELRVTTNPLV